jgi:hypothetical protein
MAPTTGDEPMKFRFFRRSTFTVRGAPDLGRLAWRVISRWKVPWIDIHVETLPLLEAQRSQVRLRHLHEVLERQTGGLLAIGVLIIGLADMVRTWNRSLEHMGMLVLLAIGVGLAGRILARWVVRLRFLIELARLRRRIRKASAMARTAAPPAADPAPVASSPVAVVEPAEARSAANATLHGRCSCGAVSFTLSRRPMMMGTCHCSACRRTGSSTVVFARRDAFELERGAEFIATDASTPLHGETRCFCSRCGSALGAMKSGSHEFPITAHLFDEDPGLQNRFHQHVSEKPSWQAICDGAMQFPGSRA